MKQDEHAPVPEPEAEGSVPLKAAAVKKPFATPKLTAYGELPAITAMSGPATSAFSVSKVEMMSDPTR